MPLVMMEGEAVEDARDVGGAKDVGDEGFEVEAGMGAGAGAGEGFPASQVRRLALQGLLAASGAAGGGVAMQLSKEAVEVLGEASKVFLHCLTATANELCAGRRKSTVSEHDVHGAFAELEFDALLPALAQHYVALQTHKRAKAAGQAKKKKEEGGKGAEATGEEGAEEVEGEDEEEEGADEEVDEEVEDEEVDEDVEVGEGAAGAAAVDKVSGATTPDDVTSPLGKRKLDRMDGEGAAEEVEVDDEEEVGGE